jgi:hypothetical protein
MNVQGFVKMRHAWPRKIMVYGVVMGGAWLRYWFAFCARTGLLIWLVLVWLDIYSDSEVWRRYQ